MMKNLSDYVFEKFQVSKDNIKIHTYAYHPKDKDELIECIKEKIEKEGLGTKDKPLNLNDIDTSEITDMSYLFDISEGKLTKLSDNGNFDISNWDVSNVEDMQYMFWGSRFNGDLYDWDVSRVTNMKAIFNTSKFDGDISNWDVSNVENMEYMFGYSQFTGKNGNISNWNVSRVTNMSCMFRMTKFNGNISDWKVNSIFMKNIFDGCPLQNNPPKWYKS